MDSLVTIQFCFLWKPVVYTIAIHLTNKWIRIKKGVEKTLLKVHKW